MDKPMKGFLKFFVFLPGSDFGNPEYSSHSSSISQPVGLNGSGVWSLFCVSIPSRNWPLGISDAEKACASLVRFVELWSRSFMLPLPLTPKLTLASNKLRSTDRSFGRRI